MIDLIFPDGSVRQYPQGSSGRDVATAISPSLAKRTLLVRLDGQLLDFDRPLPDAGGKIEFVDRGDPDALDTIRHDTAHVLAEAVQELFPGVQVTIGPNVEDGFYYDFARDEPFSTDDFAAIEKRMAESVDRDEKIVREVWDRDKAIAHFKAIGEQYKAEIIEGIPADQDVTLYRQGQWADLCRGPHLPSTKHVGKAFKLTKLAGAYWRGDQANAQLQRIYGTAWASQEDLDAYLTRLEEAEKRDHRKLGRAMDLFHMQEEGRGMVFWHPKGWVLWRGLEAYMRRRRHTGGYLHVKTPHVLARAKLVQQREGGGVGLIFKAGDLPGPRADLECRPALLQGAADAHGRVRRLSPLRAVRRPARADAGARLYPGRRPHLLPRGPDCRRDGEVHPPDEDDPRRPRHG